MCEVAASGLCQRCIDDIPCQTNDVQAMQKFDLLMMDINIEIIEICLSSVSSLLQLRNKLSKLFISGSNFI